MSSNCMGNIDYNSCVARELEGGGAWRKSLQLSEPP